MKMDRRPLIENRDDYVQPCWGSFLDCLGKFFGCCCLFPPPIGSCGCCCNPYKTVNQGSRGIVQKFGQIVDVKQPGFHYVNPITEKLTTVDVMTHVKELANQEVMTKDNLPVTIDGDVYYRRVDVTKATFSVFNLVHAIDQLAHTTLRNVFGHYTLQECLEKRDELAHTIQNIVKEQVQDWGVVIEQILIRDIRVPNHIRDMLASAATAEREAQAKLITARADVESAKMLREAADVLNTESAMQIRLLEVYNKLASSDNAKLIFMPSDYRQLSQNMTNNVVTKEL